MAAADQLDAKLYVIPGSHPAMAARRMLELKGIPYRRVDLMPVISRGVLRGLRFPSNTVPSLSISGRKLTGSREIARELDALRPEPPLYPSDPERRVAVEDAERWGEEVLQPAVRRILWNALKRNRAPLASYAQGARLGLPIGLAVKTAAPIVAAASRMNRAGDDTVRHDLASLPGWLKRIDDWIEEGVLGSDPPSAADLQIGASLRLAMTLDDLRPAIAERPAGELAVRAIPEFPGQAPPVLPPSWLEPVREVQAATAAS
ncbi:MAG: glutathione S-transferase [Actinobacteria bacterium]|nr:MAG: glutathione S-transferase [Actinomycetota bacterium]